MNFLVDLCATEFFNTHYWLLRSATLTFLVISRGEVRLLCVYERWSMYVY